MGASDPAADYINTNGAQNAQTATGTSPKGARYTSPGRYISAAGCTALNLLCHLTQERERTRYNSAPLYDELKHTRNAGRT